MREAILKALRQEGRISGEQLGRRFHISRTAVWKHIQELRRMGYRINSAPKLGYSFVAGTDLLLPEEVKQNLETRIMGRHIRHHLEAASTQDVAEALARDGADEGTVVIAEAQTKGRGRKGRLWVSPPEGGLYLSIILRPSLMPSQIVQVPLLAGVAVSRAIMHTTDLQPRIKWPGDVFLAGRKVAGIMAEMSSEVDRVNYVILGIGVNVNTPASLLAEPTGGIATSLGEQCRGPVLRAEFTRSLLREFEAVYMQFLAAGFGAVREEWKQRDGTLGSRVTVSDGGETIAGQAIDIDEDGFLLVRQESGDVRRIISGDVALAADGG